MNNYFNMKLPEFWLKRGSDWGPFQDIIEDNTDYIIKKIVDMYHIVDIDRMPVRVVEFWLNLYKISYSATDTLGVKKAKLRVFKQEFKNKGLESAYLDIAEDITGTRGTITLASEITGWVWGESTWPIVRGGTASRFIVLINVKTTDDTELDAIQSLYQDKYLKPAFYKIFLVDDDYSILREI